MIREHLRTVGQLMRTWWKVDRIRVAASTGRLLQLAPGDRLLIRDHLLMVRKRSVVPCPVERDGLGKLNGPQDPDGPQGPDGLQGSVGLHGPDAEEGTASQVEYRLVDLVDNAVEGAACDADRVVRGPGDEWRLQIVLPNGSRPSAYRLWIRKGVEELLEEEIVPLCSPDAK